MGKSIDPILSRLQTDGEVVSRLRRRHHRSDEFAASYSLAGCSPAEPTSASPAGSILNRPAELVNHHLRQVVYFSIGRMGIFQPVLTERTCQVIDYKGRRSKTPSQERSLSAPFRAFYTPFHPVFARFLPIKTGRASPAPPGLQDQNAGMRGMLWRSFIESARVRSSSTSPGLPSSRRRLCPCGKRCSLTERI